MSILFTADTHFNHAKIIQYCKRPFSCVEEMDTAIIENWNDMVSPRDTVYHLGDFAFGKNDIVKKYRYRLHGKIHLLLGNHDYKNKVQRLSDFFSSVRDTFELKHDRRHLFLHHYSQRIWPRSHYNSWHLYGHSHGNLKPIGKSLDVGVDTNNFRPYTFEEIVQLMETSKSNDIWVKRLPGYNKKEYELYRDKED